MMKKKLSLILTLVLIMTMSVTAFAENVSITKETDQKEIAGIANSFFMEKEDAFLSDGNLKIAEYYSTNDVKNIKNDSSFHLFEYEKQMRDDNYLNISDEKFEYTINSITITDGKAIVKCYEYYEYTYKNDSERSSRGTEYQLTLEKKDNKWEIVDVTSNNELENLFKETDNVSVELQFDFDIEDESNDAAITATSETTHEYDRTAAAQYALDYSSSSDGTGAYNTNFPSSKADCQNFVSQCIWAGLGGTNTATAISKKNKPMITDADRAWYCTQSGHSATWTVVGTFRDYIAKEADNKVGLYGVRYAKNTIAKAQKGDVVQITINGKWAHSYIINKVTGTYGSRTLNDIYICAHTTNRNNENGALLIDLDKMDFRLIRISGTRY